MRRHLMAISIGLNFKQLGEPPSCHLPGSCTKSQTQRRGVALPRKGTHRPDHAQQQVQLGPTMDGDPQPPPQLNQLLLAAITPITLLLPNFPLQIKTSNFQPKLNSWTVLPDRSSGSSLAPGNPLHSWCLLSAPHSGITMLGSSTASTTPYLHTLQGAYSYLHPHFYFFFFLHVRHKRAQCSS